MLFRQAVGVAAGERADQRGLAVVDVACGADDHGPSGGLAGAGMKEQVRPGAQVALFVDQHIQRERGEVVDGRRGLEGDGGQKPCAHHEGGDDYNFKTCGKGNSRIRPCEIR